MECEYAFNKVRTKSGDKRSLAGVGHSFSLGQDTAANDVEWEGRTIVTQYI
jgi:hypothetical protein|tara:strand:- start:185 stop:337 length:153 start_codon:yes stop_codon:yes gene_type:complete